MGRINFFSTLSCIQNQIDERRDAIRWCGQGNPIMGATYRIVTLNNPRTLKS